MNPAAYMFQRAYTHARSHYENFPVISWVLPRPMHPPVLTLYGYCRAVDDLGDEWPGDRLAALDDMAQAVDACFDGDAPAAFRPLQELIHRFRLPREPFHALIEANRMDQRRTRYATFDDLLHYCRHSANPVGRLFLALFGAADESRFPHSDAICTGLQLTNFWQDVSRDLPKGRIYIPLEDMEQFGYSEAELQAGVVNDAFRRLMAFQVARAHDFFRAGQPLLRSLEGGLGEQARLFVEGGEYILRQITAAGYDVLTRRPTVPAWRKGWMVAKAVLRAGTARRWTSSRKQTAGRP